MNDKKFISCLILLLLIVITNVNADNHEFVEQPGIDYQFSNPTFDYSQVNNWDTVDWSNIPEGRISEVPIGKLDYGALSFDQKFQMSEDQILNNLGKINNLAKDVNPKTVINAIKTNWGVDVQSLGDNAKIEEEVIISDNDRLDMSSKEGWDIEINEEGDIRILSPNEIAQDTISNEDSFTVSEPINLLLEDGSSIVIDQVSFEGGKKFIEIGEKAEINGYEVISNNKRIEIFFENSDDLSDLEDYVLINGDGLGVKSSEGNVINIKAQPGNELFNMLKRDYSTEPPTLIPDERDTLEFVIEGENNINIVSREEEGKTPLIIKSGAGTTTINTGRMGFILDEGDIRVIPPKAFENVAGSIDMRNSVAFELGLSSDPLRDLSTIEYEDIGTLILSSDRLRTSSSNRFVLITSTGKEIVGNNVGLEVSDLIEINMMKGIEDLRHKYSGINFDLGIDFGLEEAYSKRGLTGNPEDYDDITSNMAQMFDEWLRDKPGMEIYIQRINFNTGDNAAASKGELEFGERTADPSTMTSNPTRDLHSPLETLEHEFIHVLEKELVDNELRTINYEMRILTTQNQDYTKESDALWNEIAVEMEKRGLNPITSDVPADLSKKMNSIYDRHREDIEAKTIEAKYTNVMISKSEQILEDPKFKKLVTDVELVLNQIESEESIIKHFEKKDDTVDEQVRVANLIPLLKSKIKYIQREYPSFSSVATLASSQLDNIITENTGLYDYSFRYRTSFSEAPATYSELSIQDASRNKDLAQLEYDKVNSLGIKEGDDQYQWLIKPAEERYYAIMGGRDGEYCQNNPCGPCILYTLSCSVTD